ncbi:DUF1648 domain-containing protein [Maribacter stanieri]|uniref:DUF1648 domain-containing protein n=1 Tax=Maribacter stanieri TaxID=440514 RepID=A0A1I6IDF7_9FLAO|nr:DUF1648 domain-containing protein [Maribacter stanieri]SFR64738.1 Protein of unknown function [Maribacter stanieri]
MNLPKLEIRLTKNQQNLLLLGWFIVVLNFIIVAIFYTELPNKIPSHFNFKGEIDGYGSKDSIWTFPVLTLIIYLFLNLVIKKVKPWNMNYPVSLSKRNAPELYKISLRMLVYLSLAISIMLTPILIEIIAQAYGLSFSFNFTIITAFIVAFVTITPLYYIFKMYQIPR